MKYLCLIFFDEKRLHSLSKTESEALIAASLDYDDALRSSGHFIAAEALQSVANATTIRVQDNKTLVTDGPYAETNEQLGGFVLIEAKDLNEAIRIASKIPPARLGCVEIRPIEELTRPEGGGQT